MNRNNRIRYLIFLILAILFILFKYNDYIREEESENNQIESYEVSSIPDYSGKDVIILNNNEPEFDDLSHTTESFEVYGELDSLGRCTAAYANIGKDLMPTSSRDRISEVKPTGWQYSKYDFIEGNYLYNRCHLIAYSLTAENANPKNLITCTRYTNATLMQEYENKVGNYIRKTSNHVLYRVTPIFDGSNLIAKGVQMEALSIEDNGKGIKFNIFVYNIEPKIEIDYKTGDNHLKK